MGTAGRRFSWSVPELTNVPRKERKRLWRRALWQSFRWWHAVFILCLGGLGGWLLPSLARLLTAGVPNAAARTVLYVAMCWLMPVAVGLAVRPITLKKIRPKLRAELRAAGRCGGCGYDLTGNTSGVCPECGEPVELSPRTGT